MRRDDIVENEGGRHRSLCGRPLLFYILNNCSILRQKSLQHKSQEIRESIDLAVEADILISQLDAVFYIWIFIIAYQFIQWCCCTIIGFNFHRNKGMCIAHKEIHFKRRSVTTIIVEIISLLYQHVSCYVLIYSSFVCTEIFIDSQIFLGFFIERCNEQTCVFIINFIEFGIVIHFICARILLKLACAMPK